MEMEAFDRVKKLRVESLKQALEDPRSVAMSVAMRKLCGDGHAYSVPSGGTVASVEQLTLDDVKTAHGEVLGALRGGTIVLAGDVTESRARELLERHFGDIAKSGAAPAALPAVTVPAGFAKEAANSEGLPRVYVVDREDAPQTMVLLLAPGENFASEKRVQQQLLNVILGGSFTSRLNQNLREKHSYTYGARSSFTHRRVLGTFSAMAAVQTQVTGAALKELFFELDRVQSGDISADEVSKAAQIYATDVVGDFGTLDGLTTRAAGLATMGAPWETIANDVTASKKADGAALTQVAKQSIALDRSVLVLVGQKDEILEHLADPAHGLKLPKPIVVDANGVEVK
jgi:predicted Zn-dependent peptidase